MTEFLSSLLTQLVLGFVGVLSTFGVDDGRGERPRIEIAAPAGALAASELPVTSDCVAPVGAPASAAPANDGDACVAARMRWHITLHGPSPRRCQRDCLAG